MRRFPLILLVEDDEPLADALSLMLEAENFDCRVARNGTEAIEYLNAGGTPDLLICDYRLPGMNGLEVTHRARSILGYDLATVIISGDLLATTTDTAHLQRCILLRKPFSAETLTNNIEYLTSATAA